MVSHSDSHHAGGFFVITNEFEVGNIVLGEPLKKGASSAFSTTKCKSGLQWKLGALEIKVLSPLHMSKNNNNNSCVLRILDGKHSVLLTGDIDKSQEKRLVAKWGAQLKSDIVFDPHHGSKHSSSELFIKTVEPSYVIFSAGFMNHWGFPADEVKQRYKNQGAEMKNRGENGFTRFKSSPERINIQTYRENLAGYWYHQKL